MKEDETLRDNGLACEFRHTSSAPFAAASGHDRRDMRAADRKAR